MMLPRALRYAAILPGALACAPPAIAQDHSAHQQDEQEEHSQHTEPAPFKLPDMTGAMDHSAHQVSDLPSGPVPQEAFSGPAHAADAVWGAEAMAPSRAANYAEHSGMKTGTLVVERLEAKLGNGHDAYLWDAQGWYGGDIDKLVVKTEGEGEFGGSVDSAEVQALWGHAINPWFDLQTGIRLDLETETRSHLAVGVAELAPYMLHVEATAFLSDRGDLTGRMKAEYDQKLTQRLILQPRAELKLSAQDIPEIHIGSGLTKIETGLRLRYEIAREFAPYVGLGYEAKLGRTADIARAMGEDPSGFALILGLRSWF